MKDLELGRYYYRFYKGNVAKLLLAMLFSGGQALVNIAVLILIRYAFDATASTGHLSTLVVVGVIIILLYVVNSVIQLGVRGVVI